MTIHSIMTFTGLLMLLAGVAQPATININLNPALLSGSPGATLTFTGTLMNSTSSTVFLNGAGINLAGFSPANEDTSLFFASAPLSLAGNASTSTIGLFAINVPSPFAAGPYQGTFTVLGGADGNAQDVLGSTAFTVQVSDAGTSMPEPCSTILIGSGGLLWFACRRVRRARTTSRPGRLRSLRSIARADGGNHLL
jgi:hypothetical protein